MQSRAGTNLLPYNCALYHKAYPHLWKVAPSSDWPYLTKVCQKWSHCWQCGHFIIKNYYCNHGLLNVTGATLISALFNAFGILYIVWFQCDIWLISTFQPYIRAIQRGHILSCAIFQDRRSYPHGQVWCQTHRYCGVGSKLDTWPSWTKFRLYAGQRSRNVARVAFFARSVKFIPLKVSLSARSGRLFLKPVPGTLFLLNGKACSWNLCHQAFRFCSLETQTVVVR